MSEFERTSAELAYRGHVFEVWEERFRALDGEEFDRQIVRNPGAVAIVALDVDGTVTMIRQFRPSLQRMGWELPAGLLDKPGESLAEAAARELREEVGLTASTWEQLITVAPAPGMTDELITLFLATDLQTVEREADGAEERYLEIHRVSLDEAVRMARRGEVESSTAVIGLLLVAAGGTLPR